MIGFDLDLLNLSAPEVIEKFRKDIEKEVGEPVSTFSVFHGSGSHEIAIHAVVSTGTRKKVIKGRMINFLIRKGLKMKLKKDAEFKTVELVYSPEGSQIVMKTEKGLEIQKL